MKDKITMTTKPKNKQSKQKKATKDNSPRVFTSEEMFTKVRDISIARKMEILDNPELKEAICEFVDKLGEDILAIMEPAIQSGSPTDIQKDKLLILHLLHLRLCGEVLEMGHKIDSESDIPTSGILGVCPINTKDNTVQMYL
jgi:hypothetical protein